MAKFKVTYELASTLKSIRIQYNVTAKSVAEYIGKSQSYISKLEKAEIKTIEEEELTKIFKFIYQGVENGQESLDSILEKVYGTIELRFSDEEIKSQTWWDTYDTVRRRIPVPTELVEDIVRRMKAINLSSTVLCDRINANEAIRPDVKNDDRYPFNEWHAYVRNHHVDFYFIKVKIEQEYIDRLLNKEIVGTNYITMLAIAFYLHKIEKFGTQVAITTEENTNLNTIARDYLNSFKFFSISEKYKLSRLAKSKEEKEALVSSFDRENQELVNKIIFSYKVYSDIDIQHSNKVFEDVVENLNWDLSFMMAISSLKFSELKDISFTNKKSLLNEIRILIKKYNDLPEEQRKMNDYN